MVAPSLAAASSIFLGVTHRLNERDFVIFARFHAAAMAELFPCLEELRPEGCGAPGLHRVHSCCFPVLRNQAAAHQLMFSHDQQPHA